MMNFACKIQLPKSQLSKARFSTTAKVSAAKQDWSKLEIPLRFTGVKGNLAKALLISAYENNLTDIVRKDLQKIQDSFPDQKFRASLSMAAKDPDSPSLKTEFSHPTRILLHELYCRKILKDLPNIARAYESLVKSLNNEIEAVVTAAKKEDLANIEVQIKNALASAGRTGNVILTTKIDPSLVGGYVIEFDDFYGDFSVKSFANDYFLQKQKAQEKANTMKISALKDELSKLPHSDTLFRSRAQLIEKSFYERYQHLASDSDLNPPVSITESVEPTQEIVSLTETYLPSQTFHP